MTIAERIQHLRRARGLTQEELGDRLQVSRQAVSKWESGQAAPDLDKVLALCELFGVSTDYLLKGGDGSAPAAAAERPRPGFTPFAIGASALLMLSVLLPLLIYLPYDGGPDLFDIRRCTISLVVGAVLLAAGLKVYGLGRALSAPEGRARANRWFWLLNGWTASYLPFCCLSHLMQGLRVIKPYFLTNWSGGQIFLVLWLGVSLTVSVTCAVRLNK